MEDIVYLNGQLMPRNEAKLSVMDYGFLYGYGLFETMRAYNGVVFRLDSHLNRLTSAAAIHPCVAERRDGHYSGQSVNGSKDTSDHIDR